MVLLAVISSLALFSAGIIVLYKMKKAWLSVSLFVLTILAGAAVLVLAVIGSIQWPERTGRVQESGPYTILYRDGEGELADEVSAALHEMEPVVSGLLGEAPEARLTVRFSDRLLGEGVADQSVGVYNWKTSTATLRSGISDWKSVLLHEYVHYRSHQYQALHGTPPGTIPQWFEEGLAMYVQHPLPPADPNEVEISRDLREIGTRQDFLAALEHSDIYAQSYFAVAHLIEQYGKESVLLLMNSSSQDQFYARLEKLTGKSSADFSGSLMNAYRKDEEQMQEKVKQFHDRLFKDDFEGAGQVLAAWSAAEGSRTAKEVEDYQHTLLLHAREWKELMYSLEQKRASRPYDMRFLDYALLAELTLLFDPEQAYDVVKEAQARITEDATTSHFINQAAEPYQWISGNDPSEGYRMLIEDDLFFNQEIKEALFEKWQEDYPDETWWERSGKR
ncbi:peptidase MA family metallohydrolase [Bhargavaea massiliensis]|uniref:peptidase MA family metallohydrolase n=1 Tax=Bhargavaea massiliensis TaxID=2697500 RepID=UPI001BCE701A|nr:hypothetical protein [Bhargavaea massiliensis]